MKKDKINKKIQPVRPKKLVNVLRRKRFPLMDVWAENGGRGFGHSRGE